MLNNIKIYFITFIINDDDKLIMIRLDWWLNELCWQFDILNECWNKVYWIINILKTFKDFESELSPNDRSVAIRSVAMLCFGYRNHASICRDRRCSASDSLGRSAPSARRQICGQRARSIARLLVCTPIGIPGAQSRSDRRSSTYHSTCRSIHLTCHSTSDRGSDLQFSEN